MKWVWALDATAIAEFDSYEEAELYLLLAKSPVEISIGDEKLFVSKKDISIMCEAEFNSL